MIPESQGENYRKQETSKLDERDRVRRESPCLASLEIEAHLNSHFSYAGPGTKAPGVGPSRGPLALSLHQGALVNRLHYGPVSRLLSSCPALRHCLWRVRSPDLRHPRLDPSDGTGFRYYLLRRAEGAPFRMLGENNVRSRIDWASPGHGFCIAPVGERREKLQAGDLFHAILNAL